jgi:hypothetical protein
MASPPDKKDGPNFSYASYVFRKDEQDPIVDKIRTIFNEHGDTIGHVAQAAGVSPATLSNWFSGKTRKPQFCTTAAVIRSMGYDFVLAKVDAKHTTTDAHEMTVLQRFPSARGRGP